jgi:hypothetical protein
MSEFAPANNIDLLGDPPAQLPRAPLADAATATYSRATRVVMLPPDPTSEKHVKAHTQNKIRQAFHQLAHNNLDAVQAWLHDVARDSPARAVELFIELARFSLPQLKASEVTLNQNGPAKTYTIDELKQQLEEGS